MFNIAQFRKEIVQHTLRHLIPEIPYTEAAVELLMLTAAQESQLGTYLVQLGGGPALGVYQMEPDTHNDIRLNFLRYRSDLGDLVGALKTQEGGYQLVGNLYYATAMARVHYYRVKEPLPASDDIHGLAKYWKRHYNTYLGKGTADEAFASYRSRVG